LLGSRLFEAKSTTGQHDLCQQRRRIGKWDSPEFLKGY
jgi:hypothetical protein